MSARDPIVFDTGPLRHFAQQGWLGVLRFLTAERGAVIPESVEREVQRQASNDPRLEQILADGWLEVDRSSDLEFLVAFSAYEQRIAVGRKSLGECGVLALGRVRRWEMVLDDAVPRELAAEQGLRVVGTVRLLCDAVNARQLTLIMVESLADDLLANEYRLPFGPGGFRRFARENGLLSEGDRHSG